MPLVPADPSVPVRHTDPSLTGQVCHPRPCMALDHRKVDGGEALGQGALGEEGLAIVPIVVGGGILTGPVGEGRRGEVGRDLGKGGLGAMTGISSAVGVLGEAADRKGKGKAILVEVEVQEGEWGGGGGSEVPFSTGGSIQAGSGVGRAGRKGRGRRGRGGRGGRLVLGEEGGGDASADLVGRLPVVPAGSVVPMPEKGGGEASAHPVVCQSGGPLGSEPSMPVVVSRSRSPSASGRVRRLMGHEGAVVVVREALVSRGEMEGVDDPLEGKGGRPNCA